MPVRYVRANSLSEGLFLSTDGTRVKLKIPFGSRTTETSAAVKDVWVDQDVVDRLGDAAYVAQLAEATQATEEELSKLRVKDYKPREPPPYGHVVLPAGVKLAQGSKIKASWGSKWYDLTVLDDTTDDPVPVRWDDYGSAWDCLIVRSQLAIETTALAQARRSRGSRSRASAPPKTAPPKVPPKTVPPKTVPPKTKPVDKPATPSPFVEADAEVLDPEQIYPWRDASGEHEIQARYVGVEGTRVVLETDDGRTVRIGIQQLSDDDRARAKTFYDSAKTSPFEFE